MSKNKPEVNAGSFRDPAGTVFSYNNAIYRTVNPCAKQAYETCRDSGFLAEAQKKRWIPKFSEVAPDVWQTFGLENTFSQQPSYVIEHERLPFISYPYEWTFSQLRAAALQHLKIQLAALKHDITLSDSNAFNMQFVGTQPMHIDLLSFKPYEQGEVWVGYDQFCRQFLYPLLLEYYTGVGFQPLMRGSLEGIDVLDLTRLLPAKAKLSPRVFLHVVMRAKAEKANHRLDELKELKNTELSRDKLKAMITDTYHWVESLQLKGLKQTYWSGYDDVNSYEADEDALKHDFIRQFAETNAPAMLLDIGGNTGKFSQTAIEAGAASAVVMDADLDSLHSCFSRSQQEKLPILPIVMNLGDPSPSRGWNQRERGGLAERANFDAVMALAIIHHLSVSGNVPLAQVLDWIIDFAPVGIIEFVPKTDSMMQRMLATREDIFDDYTLDTMVATLKRRGEIVRQFKLEKTGRVLFEYRRTNK